MTCLSITSLVDQFPDAVEKLEQSFFTRLSNPFIMPISFFKQMLLSAIGNCFGAKKVNPVVCDDYPGLSLNLLD